MFKFISNLFKKFAANNLIFNLFKKNTTTNPNPNIDIPFFDRVIDLSSGFSLIWPFLEKTQSTGPYELFLDNNALITSSWINELPSEIKSKVVLNLSFALTEQWLSNPAFKDNAIERINNFTSQFEKLGIYFEKDHAQKLESFFIKNEKESRTQWMLSYLYLVLLYRVVFSKKNDNTPRKILTTIKDLDVPMFNGCIMLCTLADYLRRNQSLKLEGDKTPAFSYISSFIALHGSKKNESDVDENFLRNRAGDISLWLNIPMLRQLNYQTQGEQIAVTRDKALKKLIFRCFPGRIVDSRQMALSFDERSFPDEHSKEIRKEIEANVGAVRPPAKRQEQLKRFNILKKHVLDGANAELTNNVEQVWNEWVTPGFLGEFKE
jgi:hypothetical protein